MKSFIIFLCALVVTDWHLDFSVIFEHFMHHDDPLDLIWILEWLSLITMLNSFHLEGHLEVKFGYIHALSERPRMRCWLFGHAVRIGLHRAERSIHSERLHGASRLGRDT